MAAAEKMLELLDEWDQTSFYFYFYFFGFLLITKISACDVGYPGNSRSNVIRLNVVLYMSQAAIPKMIVIYLFIFWFNFLRFFQRIDY